MKLRPFELTLVIIFSVMAVVALVFMSSYKSDPKSSSGQVTFSGNVDIWGTVPADGIRKILLDLATKDENYKKVSYRYYPASEFDDVLLRALADGAGPDLILISQEKLVEMRQRIQPSSYESFPIRDIRNLYLDGAQVFTLSDGLYGFPVAADPLMMYWNKDILATEGYLEAPKTWEVLVNTMFSDLIQRDFDRTIRRSVVAMGEYGNVRNAFGILSTLLIQGGSAGVVETGIAGQYLIQLQSTVGGKGDPLQAAADFYTRFSRPSNALYSWNRAFKEDRQQFISGDLALYFGYASEAPQIELINPNLNFDITEVPQGASATTRRTYGRFYSLAMLKSSDNKSSASVVMLNLGGAAVAEKIALANSMVPAHRNLVALGSNDTFGRVTYKSASIAQGWLNPELAATDKIFETMTKDINENRRDLSGAVSDAVTRLRNEY